jgi:hypothetical protein
MFTLSHLQKGELNFFMTIELSDTAEFIQATRKSSDKTEHKKVIGD